MVIMPGVDSTLDQKKQIHENLDSILTDVAEQIIKGLPEGFPELTVCYFPGMGFFIGIPLSVLRNRPGSLEVQLVEKYLGDTFAFNSNEVCNCWSLSMMLEVESFLPILIFIILK